MRRHLHDRRVDTALSHQRKQSLQRRGFRSRQAAGHIAAGDADADRADQTCGAAGCPQSRLDQIRGRGLAGGPGDTEHDHAVRGAAVDVRGDLAEDRARGRVHQHRQGRRITEKPPDDDRARGVGQHRGRAAFDGRCGELGAVHRTAGQRSEQIPPADVLPAQGDPADPDVGNRPTVGSRGARRGCQRGQRHTRVAPGSQGGAQRRSPPVQSGHKPYPAEASSLLRWPAVSGADPDPGTAERSPVAAATPRWCGTAALPSVPRCRRRCAEERPS